jgi:hypothetical protein
MAYTSTSPRDQQVACLQELAVPGDGKLKRLPRKLRHYTFLIFIKAPPVKQGGRRGRNPPLRSHNTCGKAAVLLWNLHNWKCIMVESSRSFLRKSRHWRLEERYCNSKYSQLPFFSFQDMHVSLVFELSSLI